MALAYYNEIDPYAAQWLRNLVAAGHIAAGDVDERSIEDVKPSELVGYTQCHFFAGIGVWSHALRQAGWPDDKPVWTGSCPCQPFSAAGKGGGFDDERHLWPAFHHLIEQCKPATVIGEQVASKDAESWLDLVQVDLEALGYAFGAVPFPSASVGAPHIRDRLYWVANNNNKGLEGRGAVRQRTDQCVVGQDCMAGGLGNAQSERSSHRGAGSVLSIITKSSRVNVGGLADNLMQQRPDGQPGICNVDEAGGRIEGAAAVAGLCSDSGLGNADNATNPAFTEVYERAHSIAGRSGIVTGPTNGFWRDADWLLCRDGKWRPVEPGTFPLAHGATSRVGRLRAYGNAINAKAAQVFIGAYLES